MSPKFRSNGCRGPGFDVSQDYYVYINHPAMIIATVAGVSGVSEVHGPVYESQSFALFLDETIESDAIACGGGVRTHGPAGIRGACVSGSRNR